MKTCPILEQICQSEFYDSTDMKKKWQIIVKNMTEIDGVKYRIRLDTNLHEIEPGYVNKNV